MVLQEFYHWYPNLALHVMRPRIAWIRISDVDILDFLNEHTLDDFQAPPMGMAINMGIAEGTAWQRVRVLSDAGLIERTDEKRGYYKITPMGRRYLADELTDDEHQHLEDYDPNAN